MKKLIFLRRISQLFFLGFFIYVIWSTTYPLKGFISPQVLFKLDPLIMFFTAISERVLLAGILFSFLMIVGTLILGRFFCGWVCPLGTANDIAASLRKKKILLKEKNNNILRQIKYFILFVIAVFSLIEIQIAWIFDPIVFFARIISLNIIPATTWSINESFIFVIKHFELYGGFYDFYRNLKSSILGVNIYFFENSGITLIIFLTILFAAIFLSRAWCRILCPLGALYSKISAFSLLERNVSDCTLCKICSKKCRMQAIREDASYIKEECILCMDCVYNCPKKSTSFQFKKLSKINPIKEDSKKITRRDFLFLLSLTIPLLGFKKKSITVVEPSNVIRPPGVFNDDTFVNNCVRCGNCMKVCITNGLQPIFFQKGLQGLWTPQLIPEIGYCEYNCTLCGNVCPTGAIPNLPIEQKKRTKLGIAIIDKSTCIAWSQNEECLVCEEHCPVAEKAIKIVEGKIDGKKVLKPVVDKNLCIGCGICQNKCPVRPIRAIRVESSTRI